MIWHWRPPLGRPENLWGSRLSTLPGTMILLVVSQTPTMIARWSWHVWTVTVVPAWSRNLYPRSPVLPPRTSLYAVHLCFLRVFCACISDHYCVQFWIESLSARTIKHRNIWLRAMFVLSFEHNCVRIWNESLCARIFKLRNDWLRAMFILSFELDCVRIWTYSLCARIFKLWYNVMRAMFLWLLSVHCSFFGNWEFKFLVIGRLVIGQYTHCIPGWWWRWLVTMMN